MPRRSRPDRVLFPVTGFRKSDALAYYEAVAPVLLPHLKNRPISFKRYPNTINDDSFWEKNAPSFTPVWVKRIAVARRSGDSDIEYITIPDRKTLLWVVDVGGIELHPFTHKAPKIDIATEVVFDLDPGPEANIIDACAVAVLLRNELEQVKLASYSKTSGSKGLQMHVPLGGSPSHALTEAFARSMAEAMARRFPRQITARMGKQYRARKIFIDYSQNADYKTNVSAYSIRTKRQEPFVSTPLSWNEVERAIKRRKPQELDFTPDQVLRRIDKHGDLFKPLLAAKRAELPKTFVAAFERQTVSAKRSRDDDAETLGAVVNGVRLPKPKSQSGRRLFVLTRGDTGNELWIDLAGKFKRFILRPDARGGGGLIAMPAGQFPVHPSYFRGEVQPEYRNRVKIEDIGTYETIDGSIESEELAIFFTGRTLAGEWLLRKIEPGTSHRSWELRMKQ